MSVEIPKSVTLLRRRTRILYLSWWVTHYAVGFIGVVAGGLLTSITSSGITSRTGEAVYFSKEGLVDYAWLIGIVAAVCTSLVTFLGPIHKAERYWSSFHILDQACLEYEQGFIRLRTFLMRVRQARRILQAIDPDERWSSETGKEVEQEARALERNAEA